MILYSIKITLFFIILICLVDRLIAFFKENLTIPKTKDLFHLTSKKYDDMLNTISKYNNQSNNQSNNQEEEIINIDNEDFNSEKMKEELKIFLKKQLKDSHLENNLQLNDFENYNENNNYVSYSGF
jgi:hypothetical protein